MKHSITAKRAIMTALIAAFVTTMSAQDALFRKYENVKGVSIVFISKTMFRMMPELKNGSQDMNRIMKKIDRLNVLECDRPSLNGKIRAAAVAEYSRGGYELVMRTSEGGETTRIYMRKRKDGNTEYALLNEDEDELNIINITGTMTLQDIKNLKKNGLKL